MVFMLCLHQETVVKCVYGDRTRGPTTVLLDFVFRISSEKTNFEKSF